MKSSLKDASHVRLAVLGLVFAAVLAGCASRPMPAHTPAPAPVPAPPPVVAAPPAPVVAPAPPSRPLMASWTEYRRRAAQLMMQSNASDVLPGKAPDRWNGIATVTVFLNGDGSIKSLDLLRGSRVSPQVNDLAMAAVARVKNYGPVTNLPGPWQFNETFLYNDDNKFQLVTIVEGR